MTPPSPIVLVLLYAVPGELVLAWTWKEILERQGATELVAQAPPAARAMFVAWMMLCFGVCGPIVLALGAFDWLEHRVRLVAYYVRTAAYWWRRWRCYGRFPWQPVTMQDEGRWIARVLRKGAEFKP